jgi:hypothetical protein
MQGIKLTRSPLMPELGSLPAILPVSQKPSTVYLITADMDRVQSYVIMLWRDTSQDWTIGGG